MQIANAAEPLRGLVSLFYPANCDLCGAAVARGEYLCPACEEKAPRIAPPFCAKCSDPFSGAIDQEFTCANCAHRSLEFDAAVSAYQSRGIVRVIILRFKYGRALHLRHAIGRWLLRAMNDTRLHSRTFDIIVPVPLHPARLRERGFNQAELLARIVSAETNVRLLPALKRIRYTTTQTAFDRLERMENLRNAFRLRRNMAVRDLRVLLVDDVLTTGSTLSECARVLRAAGAQSVHAITAARA
jgi:competence protein ComFC